MRRLAVLFVVALGASATTAFAATLSVTTWHLWSGSQTLTKATCTLTGAAVTTDTYSDEALVGDNSAATTARVRPSVGTRRWMFVRFDISSCAIPTTGGADTATLSLRVTTAPSPSRTLTVTPVLGTWTGATLANFTGATALTYGATTTTFATGTTANTVSVPVTIDVDALIKNSTANFGWRISDAGTGTVATTLGAADNGTASNRPTLVINYAK
jgi:hypothetical protein